MQEPEQLKHVMVLEAAGDGRLRFAFQGKKWALVTMIMGLVMATGSYFLWLEYGFSFTLCLFLLFAILFCYSSLYSLTADRRLEIDGSTGTVRYVEKTFYTDLCWERPFSEFAKVCLYHPRMHDSRRRAMNVTIELRRVDGGFHRIGYNEFGSLRKMKAKELAEMVASLMGVEIEEPSG